jgi:hypothetical protein
LWVITNNVGIICVNDGIRYPCLEKLITCHSLDSKFTGMPH